MKMGSLVAFLVLAAMIVGSLVGPSYSAAATGAATASASPFTPAVHPIAPSAAVPAAPLPTTSYSRTVLIETFTAEWCIYCEQESQALYAIEHQTTRNVIDISEIHDCYSSQSCGDNYQTTDSTSSTRTSYYNVQAFPTVYFDGGHVQVGAAQTLSALEGIYNNDIANASSVPGNVSIVQSAMVSSAGTVSDHATITSAVNGSYKAIMYLVEYIGKNDSTGHDLGYIVRSTLVDQTVDLTPGGTIQVNASGAIGSTWNQQHLSVVTFVQQYNTRIVQNTNLVPVRTIAAAVGANPGTVPTGYGTNVTVSVTNSSTGALIPGANVSLSWVGGGSAATASGVTDGSGVFTTAFTAPQVSDLTTVILTAEVSAAGYTIGFGNGTLTVNPLAPPTVPLALAISPMNSSILVSWNAPSSGGGGVTYFVYRATTQSGVFTELGSSTGTTYLDTQVTSEQAYWYKVSAQNAAGFSGNASAVSAAPLMAMTQGLPSAIGWWLSIDSMRLTSATNGSLSLHLPDGFYSYTLGPASYVYEATTGAGTVSVAGGNAVTITAAFQPRWASLLGTVTPSNATVTLNGTAVAVSGGTFTQTLIAGTYQLVATHDGYVTETQTVVLTPGNQTTVALSLNSTSPGGGSGSSQVSSSNGGLSMMEVGLIGGAVAIAAIAVVVGLALSTRGRRGRQPPAGGA